LRYAIVGACVLLAIPIAACVYSFLHIALSGKGVLLFGLVLLAIAIMLAYFTVGLWLIRGRSLNASVTSIFIAMFLEFFYVMWGIPFGHTYQVVLFTVGQAFYVTMSIVTTAILVENWRTFNLVKPPRILGHDIPVDPPKRAKILEWLSLVGGVLLFTSCTSYATIELDKGRRKTAELCSVAEPGMTVDQVETKATEKGVKYSRLAEDNDRVKTIMRIQPHWFVKWHCIIRFEEGIVSTVDHESSYM
jgi:hypothetical protein